MTSALVVGYGSIGARHARILSGLGVRTAVFSRREIDFPRAYASLAEALRVDSPDYIVVANETVGHRATLAALADAGFAGTVLVEKPLFHDALPFADYLFGGIFVAYNLRFHAILQRVKQALVGERILSAHIYAGQYLPDWRPGTDYRQAYSASAEQGGGVLRDLSHELDCIVWLFGGWTRVASLGGHLSPLEINSDDVYALMLATPVCPIVNVQINYLDRPGRRSIIVNTERLTVEANLGQGTISINGKTETVAVERDASYLAMHAAALAGDAATLCSLEQGHETMRLIAAAEKAAHTMNWISR